MMTALTAGLGPLGIPELIILFILLIFVALPVTAIVLAVKALQGRNESHGLPTASIGRAVNFCSSCGATVAPGSRFCSICGTVLA